MEEDVSAIGGGGLGGSAPFLANTPAAPMAAPVPIGQVAFNPAAPIPTTNLLQEAYNRLMAPTATGTIAQRPAWAQARIDQANQAQTAGVGQVAQSGGGGGGGGTAYSSNVPGQRVNVEGMRKGAEGTGLTDAGTRRMDIEGMRTNVEGMRKDVEGTGLTAAGTRRTDIEGSRLLPNLGVYQYDRLGRRIK